jgi:hypothetical protein
MPGNIPPPTHVLTDVMLAWTTGTIVLAAASRFFGEIQPGHFKVMWLVGAGLGFASGFGYRYAFAISGLCLVTYVTIYADSDGPAGSLTAVASLIVLGAGTDLSAESFAVALLLGAVSNAMLLGHWHLNQPRLGTKPIARLVRVLWAGLVCYLAVTASIIVHPKGVGGLAAATGLAFAAFCLILTAMVHHLVRTRSIMSATGILYLEILMCLVAGFTGTLAALARA